MLYQPREVGSPRDVQVCTAVAASEQPEMVQEPVSAAWAGPALRVTPIPAVSTAASTATVRLGSARRFVMWVDTVFPCCSVWIEHQCADALLAAPNVMPSRLRVQDPGH